MTRRTSLLAPLLALALILPAHAALKANDVPTFTLKARVLKVAGEVPAATAAFTYTLGAAVKSTAVEWSAPLTFDAAAAAKAVASYPNNYAKGWPLVLHLGVAPVKEFTEVEVAVTFTGREALPPATATGRLFGGNLGLLIWREAGGTPQAASMAAYNRRFWQPLAGATVPPAERPQRFPIIDRFIGGDADQNDWQEGIEQLAGAGFSAIMLPPDARWRDVLLTTGNRRTAWAVYNPPGYAFDYDEKVTPASIADWARQQAAPYLKAGYAATDMAAFAMSDEPGWYFPAMLRTLEKSPAGLARFRDYVKAQGLTPADVGVAAWDELLPLGRSGARDLPTKRRFYWSMRFFAWDSARHFAVCTRALEEAFAPGAGIFTNWNFFSGRFYVPGPVANNGAKQDPDAAMGGHDWFEFGRLRGGTLLWTEDWFDDARAWQWSFYASKLRCAAAKGGVEFGAYVIPRTAGSRPDGIAQKILCAAGSGAKAIKYFVFGPEYNFPGNCYSMKANLLPEMAKAHRLIGAAESVLWPGRRPPAAIAILMPRSAQCWDLRDIAVPTAIYDATNTDPNRATMDYLAEVFDLYVALQHANIPVDWVDEDDLEDAAGLKRYRVLYVTAPDVPAAGQQGLATWLRAGGVLVTVSGTAAGDRYHEPCDLLSAATGVVEAPRERLTIEHANRLAAVGAVAGEWGGWTAFGMRGVVKSHRGTVRATFADDPAPAVIETKVDAGTSLHFAALPGLSYFVSGKDVRDKLPQGFNEALRAALCRPLALAGVTPPVTVSVPLVETPLLVSDAGAALTLLNWTGAALEELEVTVRLPPAAPAAKTARSLTRGPLALDRAADGALRFRLALAGYDIVVLTP